MVTHLWGSLVLTFMLLSYERYTMGQSYSKEQSWSNHNLSSVPPDLAVGVRRLDLSNNFIRQLHALALPYLEQLDASSNQLDLISEGFFQNLAKLEELNLSQNMLNNNVHSNGKAFQSINRLKILDISSNGLGNEAVELYLQNKSTLDHLKMSGNVLQRLSRSMFEDSTNLKTISFDNNLISVIELGAFELLRQLEKLNLAQNNLANICDFKLYSLKYLNLSGNSIEFFVTHQNDLPYRLEILDLSFNKLLYFPILPKLNHLRYLHLQQNNIGAMISEAEMVTEDNALYNEVVHGNNIAIKKNYLHYNWRVTPLIHIDLSYNQFRTFPLETLSLLSSLETLNFSHNCVHNISWNIRNESESGFTIPIFYSSLKHLDLQSNKLVHISPLFLETLLQIASLNLQDNSVQPCSTEDHYAAIKLQNKYPPMSSCMSFRQLRTLKHLNLRENNIKTLYNSTFERNHLISLNLGNNPCMVIQKGAIEALPKTLQSLTLSELNISEVVLPCLPALTHLNISNNILESLPSNIACSPLIEIDLRNNMLQYLNQSVMYTLTSQVQRMYISGNPFKCCENTWLSLLNESKVPDMKKLQCVTGSVKIQMQDYQKNYTIYCGDLNTTPLNHNIGQLVIVIVFVVVLFAAVYMFCKNILRSLSFIV
ncbi:transforming growth factor beta activator LRRC33-like [Eucyclogobius newberryi]|uniref:transforming growth factor beta activator LRRC33-like n=1 Tax=Eucyclogobius newberryi TaxID=166745 RepID=UPI003B5CD99E